MPGEGGGAGLPALPGREVQLRPDVRLGEAGGQSGLVKASQGGLCQHRVDLSLQQKCEICVITILSAWSTVVESFIVVKYFHGVAIPALLCHKEPAQALKIQQLVLYGIRELS